MLSIAPKSPSADSTRPPAPRGWASPPWRDLVLPGLALAVTLWLAFWSVDYPYVRTTRLTAHVALEERMVAERSAFSIGGGHGGFFAVPFLSRSDRVQSQTFVRDGTPVYTVGGRAPAEPGEWVPNKWVRPAPSPDGRFVALEDVYAATNAGYYPIEILDVRTGRVVRVGVPDPVRARAEQRYPLRFHGWTPDSRLALARFDGRGVDAHDLYVLYRELWGADASSGTVALVRRCEVPAYGAPSGEHAWRATPCAER